MLPPIFRSSAIWLGYLFLVPCTSSLLALTGANAQLIVIPSVPDANQPPANTIGIPCVDDFCTPTAGANVIQYWDSVMNHPNAIGAAAGLSTNEVSEYLSWFMATNAHRDGSCAPVAADQWGRTNARSGTVWGTVATDAGPGLFEYVRWDDRLYRLEGTLPQPPLPGGKAAYNWRVETELAGSFASNADLLKAYQDEIDAGRPNLVSFQHWHLAFLCVDAGIEYYEWLAQVPGTTDPGFNPEYSEGGEVPNEEWTPENLGHTATGVGYNLGFAPPCLPPTPRDWIIVHDNFAPTGTDVAVPFLYDIPGNQTWMTSLTSVALETGHAPEVAVDPVGNHHVAWWDGDAQIYYEQNAAPGTLAGTPIKTGKQPDIAVDPVTGDIVIVFSKPDAFLIPNIYATTSSDGGATWSADVLVSTIPNCGNCREPSVVVDSSGHTHVAWEDDCDLIDLTCGADFEIFSNDKPAGGVWGAQQQVTQDSVVPPFLDDIDADLSTDGSDVFLVWDRDHGEVTFLRGAVSGGATSWIGASKHVVNALLGQRISAPAVAADPSGDVHVVWSDLRTGLWQTYHQANNLGSWQAADIQLSNATTTATTPDITARTAPTVGTALYASWEEEVPAGNYEILSAVLFNDGTGNIVVAGLPVNVSNTDFPSLTPAVLWDDANAELDTVWAEDPIELPEPSGFAAWLVSIGVLATLSRLRTRA